MSTSGLVAILFTDLAGSTALAVELGEPAADALRRAHFASLREAIAAKNGTEVKTIGDAVMVSFGGAVDAIACAVAMQRAVDRHNRVLDGVRLQMRVGVSAGEATFEEGDWFGTPVVEAARLCAAAGGEQILVHDVVRSLAGSRAGFELRPLGERALKGLPDPVAVCEIDWHAPDDDTRLPLPSFVDTGSTFPFAGRGDTLEVLAAAWKDAAAGARRIVLVSGEPGIGKTRLVGELVRQVHAEGATVLWGRCDEEGGIPYQPFVEALGAYSAAVPTDRLLAELGPLGGEVSRLLPDLGDRVAGLAAPSHNDPEMDRYRLFEAVSEFLGEMSQTRPVVLVLDDLHWSDKPSLLLLRHLVRSPTPMRLLVLGTYRDTDLDRRHPLADALAELRRDASATRLDLHGLDRAGVDAFFEAAAGHDLDEAALALAATVHDESQGNPFFIGEVLRHLVETGQIVTRDGRWTAERSLGDIGVPEGIREVVGRRLSRLSDDANQALTIGAVVGAEFDLATVQASGGPSGDSLLDALDEASAAAIVHEVDGRPGRYAFAHALVRSTIYEELPSNQRVRTHWRIAQSIATRHAHDLDAHLDELAYHAVEGALAGDQMVAVGYGRRAGDRAFEALAFEAAARHYERALLTLDLVEAPDLAVRCDLQLALSRALRDAGDVRWRDIGFGAASSAGSIPSAGRLVQAARILTEGVQTSAAFTADTELIALLETALEAIGPEPSGDRARLLNALSDRLAWTFNTGDDRRRLMELAREAVTTARESGDHAALSQVLLFDWAAIDWTQPSLHERAGNLDEAIELSRVQGSAPIILTGALRGRGVLAGLRGDSRAFAADIDEAARIADSVRLPILISYSCHTRASYETFLGNLDRAEQLVMEGIDHGRRGGALEANIAAVLALQIGAIRRAQGRIAGLVKMSGQLVAEQPEVPFIRAVHANFLSCAGRHDDARTQYLVVVEDGLRKIPNDIWYPLTLLELARLAVAVRPTTEVLNELHRRLEPFAGTFTGIEQLIADANDSGLAMITAALGRHDESDAHFAAAIDLCERAGARPFLARYQLDWADQLAERGDTDAARPHAQVAIEIGAEIGSTGAEGVVPLAHALLARL